MSRTGKNIRMYRERLGWSQEQLAAKVHYSDASMITQIEAGTKSPSLDKAEDLAIQLGVPLSALVGEPCAAHGVTNNASGDHTVIQNIDGHYCALDRETLGQLVDERLAARLTAFETTLLARITHLLEARGPPSSDGALEGAGVQEA